MNLKTIIRRRELAKEILAKTPRNHPERKQWESEVAKLDQVLKEVDAYNPDRDIGAGEKFLIGAGRGIMDTVQGIKQKGLRLGEKLGLAEEGASDRYTDRVNREIARYEQDFPGLGMESLGRFTGWVAPTAPLAPATVPRMAALGAAEAGAMFGDANSWEQDMMHALVGGTTGGLLGGAQRMFTTPRPSTYNNQIGAEYAAKEGIKLRPHHLADGGEFRTGQNIADSAFMSRSSENTLNQVKDHMEGLAGANRYEGHEMLDALETGWQALKKDEARMYDFALNTIGDAPVDARNALLRMMDVIDKASGTKKRRLMTVLDDAIEDFGWKSVRTPNGKRAIIPTQQTSLRDLMKFRSYFGSDLEAEFAKDGLKGADVRAIYRVLSDELYGAASRADRNGPASQMLSHAIRKTRKRHEMNRRVGYKAKTMEENIQELISGDNLTQKVALRELLDMNLTDARKATKGYILKDMLDAGNNGQEIFGAGQAAARGRKALEAARTILGKEDYEELLGLTRMLDMMKTETRVPANLPTGQQAITYAPLMGVGMMGAAAGGTAMSLKAILAVEGGRQFIRGLMRRRDVSAMMRRMAREAERGNIRGQIAIANDFNRLVQMALRQSGKVAVTPDAPAPIQIEIRNGRPQ